MKKLSIQYLGFLGILMLIIITSQILIQKTISDSKSDARIINISGRQRMLSQKITKAALKLQTARSRDEYFKSKLEMTNAAELLEESHNSLKHGSDNIDVSEMNKSSLLNKQFVQIEPYYESISGAVNTLKGLGFDMGRDGSDRSKMEYNIELIKSNESEFLRLMNDITFEYDRLASEKVEELSSSEYYLLGITLLLILLEGFFIFRPMFKTARKKQDEISELHDYVQQSISIIGKSQTDKKYAATQINEANQKIGELKHLSLDLKSRIKELENNETLKQGETILKYSEVTEMNRDYEKKIKTLEKELARIKTAI